MARPQFADPVPEDRDERRFRLLAEAIPQIVWTSTVDGRRDYQNRRWSEYSGMTAEESLDFGWLDAVHPDDLDGYRSGWEQAAVAARAFESEYRLRGGDGRFRWFLTRAEPIVDDEDRAVRWFGTCTDIDDRKAADEARIREDAERLRLAADAARLGYWDWDIPADAITWSDSLVRLSGTTPERFGVTFASFLGLVHPDDRARVEASVRLAIDRGTAYHEEFRLVNPDGSYRWGLARGQAYYDREGRPKRMSGIEVDVTARKELEEQAARGQERFRASVDSLIDCFGIYTATRDGEGRIVDFRVDHVNEPACRDNRLGREEQVGRGLLEIHPAHRESGLFDRYCRVVETGETLDIEEASHEGRHGGERVGRVFAIRASKLGDGFACAWRDVTGRKEAEAELEANRHRSRRIADISPVVLCVHGLREGSPVYFNREMSRALGFTAEQIAGLGPGTAKALMHPDDSASFAAHLDRVRGLPDDAVAEFEFRMRHADGAYRWFASRDAVFQRDAAGEVTHLIGAAIEVTDRKRSEEDSRRLHAELNASLQELRTILDTAPVGINIARDPACKVIVGNLALTEMLGVEGGENVSKSRDDAQALPFRVLKGDREPATEALPMQRAAASGLAVADELYEIVRADGGRIPILARANPIRDDAGTIVGAVGICVDVTDLRRAEAALIEADRRKDEFLATLAHELRNPFAAISNAHLLARVDDAPPEDRRWAIGVIDRQLGQLGRLIDDLLDVSRIGRGKIRLRLERVDASEVVARAVESVRTSVEARRHELSVTASPDPMPLEADPTRLEQVLANLLNNAAKYTDEGGRIALDARPEGDEVVIRVRDDGVGIPPAMLPKVFDLFAQVDDSIERSHGGLGIGLTLVRTLAEMHGGRVSVESEGPGRGSEFTVRLPRRSGRPEEAPATPAPTRPRPGRGRALRILVVDDNPDTLGGMSRLLGRRGHRVTTAVDGPSAIRHARDRAPEIAILDIGLPGMSGFEVARAIRRDSAEPVVLIALSGYAREKDREQSSAAGFDHHLAKPVDIDALLAILDAIRPPA